MDDKRAAIIQAAGNLLEEGGPITVDRVAEAAGVAKGTVYLYFKSKQDLIRQTLVSWIDDLYGVVDAAARDHNETATSRLALMIDAHYLAVEGRMMRMQRLFSDDPDLFREGGDCLAVEIMTGLKRLEDRYAKELRAGVETGEFRPHGSDIVAAALLGLIHNLGASQAFRQHLDRNQIVSEVLDMVLHGISRSLGASAQDHEESRDREGV